MVVLGSHVFLVTLNVNDCIVQLEVILTLSGRKAIHYWEDTHLNDWHVNTDLKTALVSMLLQKKYILSKDVLLEIASLHKEKHSVYLGDITNCMYVITLHQNVWSKRK